MLQQNIKKKGHIIIPIEIILRITSSQNRNSDTFNRINIFYIIYILYKHWNIKSDASRKGYSKEIKIGRYYEYVYKNRRLKNFRNWMIIQKIQLHTVEKVNNVFALIWLENNMQI